MSVYAAAHVSGYCATILPEEPRVERPLRAELKQMRDRRRAAKSSRSLLRLKIVPIGPPPAS